MDREEARLTQLAAAVMAARYRADEAGIELLVADFNREPRRAEGFVLLAIVAASIWCQENELPDGAVDQLWPSLPPPAGEIAALVNRAAVTELATALQADLGSRITAAQARLSDPKVYELSALDLAGAALDTLAEATATPAADWCQVIAGHAAAGVGVVDE